ncbi:hybrid sensor histidine kinase/response regulator [Massilia sp. YIM B02443]|uniref:hybrid sensor histidine kinase/response regulator n=1 Tax=Massilia sp. YIM B02443 TaxID=3050127 RepID=UPI0025B6D0DB|nr:hybrid sensor histidine kinase/response regulator [Massilia sp. YIM B02443]MDN4038856.1 hybrid sensor histidine kinase/response regulator [Massilia sp. YIM B02443]
MTRPTTSPLIPGGAALGCLLLAGAALAGWWLHLPLLIGADSGRPQMYPATALGFVCTAGALLLQLRTQGAALHAGRVLALALLVFSLGAALMRGAGWAPPPLSLGIGASANAWSLPAPLTAGLFVVLGASLVLVGARRSVAIAQALAAGLLLFALLTLAGFAAEDTVLYQLLPGRGTSLRTALGFVLASVAVLALRPERGLMVALASDNPSSRTLRRLLGPLVLTPILLGMVATWAVRTADAGIDLTTMIWLFVWGLLVILIAVVWRLAYQLYRQDLTRSLAERERNEALAALRLADERKNEFLAMLAHELRNPLAPISTAAELLKSVYASDPAQVRRTSEIIGRQVNHMVHLVDDLLDVSRVTRGIIELERQAVDLRQTVTAALEQAQPLMQMKRQRLRTELPESKVLVEGDPKRLIQVLANLLGNAAKYTPEEGSVLLAVRTHADQAQLVVQDDGIGIAPELLPDVFGLFTQARRTPDRAEGGLGLGLALVKNLVELHGGRVEAASDGPGHGSTFTVTLPRLTVEPPPPPPLSPLQAPPALRRGSADDVLVVDDNQDAAASLALLLDAEGYRVQVEHAPAPALQRVLAQPPGACILDIGLPDMDGRELARRIRAGLKQETPLLIALTGYGSDADRALALDAGFDHYLVKPADMRQLAALLDGVQASPG